MQALTLKGFLARYVRHLSYQNTNDLRKLAKEAVSDSPRLREPLLLFALYSGKSDRLLQVTMGTPLCNEYERLLSQFDEDSMTQALMERAPSLALEYHKVWNSYQYHKNYRRMIARIKETMRAEIRERQKELGFTAYRLAKGLDLDLRNVYAWLNRGESSRVSSEAAAQILEYTRRMASARQEVGS